MEDLSVTVQTVKPDKRYRAKLSIIDTTLPRLLTPTNKLSRVLTTVTTNASTVCTKLNNFGTHIDTRNFASSRFTHNYTITRTRNIHICIALGIFIFSSRLSSTITLKTRTLRLNTSTLVITSTKLTYTLDTTVPKIRVRLSARTNIRDRNTIQLTTSRLKIRHIAATHRLAISRVTTLYTANIPVRMFYRNTVYVNCSKTYRFSTLQHKQSTVHNSYARPYHLTCSLISRTKRDIITIRKSHLLYPRSCLNVTRLPRLMSTNITSLGVRKHVGGPSCMFGIIQI